MPLIIGLVGENGAGKSRLAAELLDQAEADGVAVESYRFSIILTKTLELWGQPKTRHNLQRLISTLRGLFGPEALAIAIHHLVKQSSADLIILDGMRWQEDYDLVRSFSHNRVIYITASPKVRYHRLTNREEKEGESVMAWEQFEGEEQAQSEVLIPTLGSKADKVFTNHGSAQELQTEIASYYSHSLKPELHQLRSSN